MVIITETKTKIEMKNQNKITEDWEIKLKKSKWN